MCVVKPVQPLARRATGSSPLSDEITRKGKEKPKKKKTKKERKKGKRRRIASRGNPLKTMAKFPSFPAQKIHGPRNERNGTDVESERQKGERHRCRKPAGGEKAQEEAAN